MNHMIHVNAQYLLSDLYLSRSKSETQKGNLASAQCYYVLSKETRKIANQEFQMEVKNMKQSSQRKLDGQRFKMAVTEGEKYKGILGWCRYKWLKFKLLWARIQNRVREKRKGKISLLTDLAIEENEEEETDEEEFNVEFIDNVVIDSLPVVPQNAIHS